MSVTKNQETVNKIHHNIPQIVFNIVRAHITLCLWARASGKTEGPGVDFNYYNAMTMPRSLGGLVSVSYDKLLTFIVPKIVKGYERYGLIENVHFWVRKFAPPELKRPKPFLKPTDAKHFIHLFNGSGQQLISLDRLGISNAADLDYIYADECKLFDYEKFVEVLHTNRGNDEHFGHLSQHHSVLLTTDRPRDSSGDWLYDIAEKADPEMLDLVLMIQQRIFELNEELKSTRTKKSHYEKTRLIEEFESQLNELRKELVYVSEANTLDNMHAIGTNIIKDLKRTLEDLVYRISVLNERVKEVESGFYKDLNYKKHGAVSINSDYLDNQDFDFKKIKADSRWYRDIQRSEPIDIGMDHNAGINTIVSGQGSLSTYRFIHSAYTKGKVQSLLNDEWHAFFQYHDCKVINYYYDHTSIPGKADSDLSIADEVTIKLQSLGWVVNRIYIGQQPSHKSRYILWEKILNELDHQYPSFKFNTTTCEYWFDVCKQTRAKIGRDGFEKDKSDEKRRGFDQSKSPHITDAGDTLLVGAVHYKYKAQTEFLDTAVY